MTAKLLIPYVVLAICVDTITVCTASHHDDNDIETSKSHANIGTTGIIVIAVIGALLSILIGVYIAYKCGAFKRCTKKVRPNPAHTVDASTGQGRGNRRIIMTGHHPLTGRPLPAPFVVDSAPPPPPPYSTAVMHHPPPPAMYVQPNVPMEAPPQYTE